MIDKQNKIIAFETALLRVHPELVGSGYMLREINFSEALPHTKKFDGLTGLQVVGCNVFNCDFPPDTIFDSTCAYVGVHRDPEPEIVDVTVNDKLAALAVAVKTMIETSGNVPEEKKASVNLLAEAVKQISNSNPTNGEAATKLVYELLADPAMEAYPEVVEQIKTALADIIVASGGDL